VLKVLFWIFALPLLVFVVVFAASNPDPVKLNLWPFTELDLPLYAIVLTGGLLGCLFGALLGWASAGRSRRRSRELMRELEAERRGAMELREKVARFEAADQEATIPTAPAAAI
jgi:uncharacterized integral membrane protein